MFYTNKLFLVLLIIYNNLLHVRSILLCVLIINLYQCFLSLLFHQIWSIFTNYIELESNGSNRTNMPLPTCALFCPLLPLQDYLLQGCYSSFSLYSLLCFLPHHHSSFCYSQLLLLQTMVDSFHSFRQSLPLLLHLLLHSQLMNFPQAYQYANLDYVYYVPYQMNTHLQVPMSLHHPASPPSSKFVNYLLAMFP